MLFPTWLLIYILIDWSQNWRVMCFGFFIQILYCHTMYLVCFYFVAGHFDILVMLTICVSMYVAVHIYVCMCMCIDINLYFDLATVLLSFVF